MIALGEPKKFHEIDSTIASKCYEYKQGIRMLSMSSATFDLLLAHELRLPYKASFKNW